MRTNARQTVFFIFIQYTFMADFKRTMLHESSVLTARVIKSTRSVFRNARTCYGVRDVTRLSAGEIAKKQRGEFELIRWEKKKKKRQAGLPSRRNRSRKTI